MFLNCISCTFLLDATAIDFMEFPLRKADDAQISCCKDENGSFGIGDAAPGSRDA